MKLRRLLYRLFLSVTATSVINLSMIFLTLRRQLRGPLQQLNTSMQSLADTAKGIQGHAQNEGTQLDKLRRKNVIKIKVLGDKAYWVHNNTFYEGSVVNGLIDREAAKPIDAYKLSPREFSALLDILDNIT